jgi:D-alanyl-D-alanine carboxypeptidase
LSGPSAGARLPPPCARPIPATDPATGAVLWGRRSRTSAAPASLTKMLTALTVRASFDLDTVTVASAEGSPTAPAIAGPPPPPAAGGP